MNTKKLFLALGLAFILTTPAMAGDVLWFTGHNGYDEGHVDIVNLLTGVGATVDVVTAGNLPALGGYSLVMICMPGFFDPGDFFTAAEKADLNTWLAIGSHRVVMIGDWDAFYQGQAVMNDLLAAIGNPIQFVPGAYDSGCGHCSGPLGAADPLTAGLTHVCYAFTPTWNPSFGVPLTYPEDPNAPGPNIVSNGTNIPCIVGIGDQNTTTDPCGYTNPGGGDADTKTFHIRLYTITCAGEPEWACCLPDGTCTVLTQGDCAAAGGSYHDGLLCNEIQCEPTATVTTSWGKLKSTY